MPKLERGLHVERIEDLFNRNLIRLVRDNDFSELSENPGQASRQRFARVPKAQVIGVEGAKALAEAIKDRANMGKPKN